MRVITLIKRRTLYITEFPDNTVEGQYSESLEEIDYDVVAGRIYKLCSYFYVTAESIADELNLSSASAIADLTYTVWLELPPGMSFESGTGLLFTNQSFEPTPTPIITPTPSIPPTGCTYNPNANIQWILALLITSFIFYRRKERI